MVVRNIAGLDWEAISPSEYKLVDYTNISVIFTGRDWRFKNDPVVGFKDMKQIAFYIREMIDMEFSS